MIGTSQSQDIKEDFIFLGTVKNLKSSSLPPPSLANWIVEFQIDKVLFGEFSSKTFSFRVHSPANSGLKVGKQYKVKAVKMEGGYSVDEFQFIN